MNRKYRQDQEGAVFVDGDASEQSSDSMLTISDELGNMEGTRSTLQDPLDIEVMAVEVLSVEFTETPQLDSYDSIDTRDDIRDQRAQAYLDQMELRRTAKLNLLDRMVEGSARIQLAVQRNGEALNERMHSLVEGAKESLEELDSKVRAKPYAYAIGAVAAGFVIGRIFMWSRQSSSAARIS